METALKRTKTMPVYVEKPLPDNDVTLQKNDWINRKIYEDFIKRYRNGTLTNDLLVLKVQALDDEIVKIKSRQSELEEFQHTLKKSNDDTLFTYEAESQKSNLEKNAYLDDKKDLKECESIIERAIEILAEWSETQDIKLQIQYAAVIVGKIENIKKKDFVQGSEIRKKICTLLRTVIRLNVADTVFTKEHILLLKRGFSLLTSDNIKKEDMLQLGRELRKEHLATMPAWE